MARYPIKRLPADPLRRFTRNLERDNEGRQSCCNRVELSKGTALHRAMYRAVQEGSLTWIMADRLACALGHHPSDLWPEWWTLEDTA